MKRVAFKMFLNKGSEVEYKKRHDAIWPEIKDLLKETGIAHYSIFLDEETSTLFGVLECYDEDRYQNLAQESVMQKWWDFMKDLMQTNADHSPKSINLKELFYLE